MRSKISFFNKAVLRKDLTRFFPAWVLFALLILLAAPLLIDPEHLLSCIRDMGNYANTTAIFSFLYAMITAQLLFGDLFQSRMCNALHAMPLRRETWFGSHVLAGLCFVLIPYAPVSLLMAINLGAHWGAALLFFAGAMLIYVFFFGTAVCSMLCTGNRFAAVVLYGILNFLPMILYWIVDTIYMPLLPGVVLQTEKLLWFCPPVSFYENELISLVQVRLPQTQYTHLAATLRIQWSQVWYIGICALIGVALLVTALLLYRKRQLECAGDFICVKALRPVFLVLFSLITGVVFKFFFSLFLMDTGLILPFLGVIIGFFAGQMLLKRTVRIFTRRFFLALSGLLAALALSLGITAADPMGLTRWVPEDSEVTQAKIFVSGSRLNTQMPESISKITAIHRQLISAPRAENGYIIYLEYTLENGKIVEREYRLNLKGELRSTMQACLSTPEAVFDLPASDDSAYLDQIQTVQLPDDTLLLGDDARSLLEAMLKDCHENTMSQSYALHPNTESAFSLYLTFDGSAGESDAYVTIFNDCEHTLQWLTDFGYLKIKVTDQKSG